ncbi:MAG: efflux RND transporter permease subunit, partial [Elusimicrobia bacterium]|nr:efflux RND transporter permease subunit [Elusimicrobiota bacterium]
QVQVITQYPGKAAEEIERQITVPLEVATVGTPGLINQRSISLFGLSVITLTFDDNVALRQARLDVSQRLADADIPEGVKPGLSPESTPTGEIFRYTLKGDLPIDEMRLIEEWTIEREFKSIPGVADVVSFGGPLRTIEVRLDVPRMTALGLTPQTVAQALGENSANAGGSVISHGDEAFVVRSLGLYERPEDLEGAVVGTKANNVPIRVRDIGSVRLSHRMRLGQVSRDEDDDVVEGIIDLRKGHDTLGTCRQIREKIAALNDGGLPGNVKIVPYYDRTDLIQNSSHTVYHNIFFGVLLVCVLLTLGFGFAYRSLIAAVAVIIPFALLVAFVGLRLLGIAPNLISLGAVDFGIIVETAIFAAESVIFALRKKARVDAETVSEALDEVLAPALLCAVLLIIAFIPILSLQRVEGRIFKPLGITLVSALIGGQLGAIVFIPLFSFWAPAGGVPESHLDHVFERILEKCSSVAGGLARRPALPWISGAAFAVVLVGLLAGLGREFLPQLNEGALFVRATAPPTISRDAASDLAHEIRGRLHKIPEVTDVVTQIGRPDDGTDINGFDNIEFHVNLVHPKAWKTAKTIDGFIEKAKGLLDDIPGVEFNFSQPIKDNVDEAISGVKGELVVKIFGPKLEVLQQTADQMVQCLKKVPGADDVAAEQLLGQPELRFTMNRDMLARYGLRVTDGEDVLETALLGKLASRLVDEQGRLIDVLVKPDIPDNPNESILASLPVLTPDGANIPLKDVASPRLVGGVSRIYREYGKRRIAVKLSVRGRAVVDFVNEAKKAINQEVKLPAGYRTQWSGSFENAQRAGKQLGTIVPVCTLAIVIILFSWFNSWRTVGFLLWEIPFSAVGGFAALRILGLRLSISAAAGAIVLIGVSFLTGMMLISGWIHQGSALKGLKEE